VAILIVQRKRLRGWFALDGRGLAIGLVGGLVQAGLTHAGYHLVAIRIPAIQQQVVALYDLMGTGMGPMRALPIVVLAIVVEELVWRGVAFESATGSQRTWLAGLVSALLYTAAQAGSGSWALATTAFVCGWVWWGARVWGKSLTPPILMHLVWSLVVLVFLPLETG
jgi:membrane protease YdiL (CAAX protease family)